MPRITLEKKKTIGDRVKELETKLKEFKRMGDANRTTMLNRINALEIAIGKQSARLDNIEPNTCEQFLNRAKKDAIAVHQGYKALILKNTVATELMFFERNNHYEDSATIARTVIRAFDEPVHFWVSREHYSLNSWLGIMRDLTVKYAAVDMVDKEGNKRRSAIYREDL